MNIKAVWLDEWGKPFDKEMQKKLLKQLQKFNYKIYTTTPRRREPGY